MAALIVPLSVATIVIILVASFVSYNRISTLRDAEMRQDGVVLSLLLKHEATEGDRIGEVKPPDVPAHLLDGRMQFRVTANGTLVSASDSMPKWQMPLKAGFSDFRSEGQYWRMLRISGGRGIWIDVAEPHSLRRSLTYSMVGSLALPLILMALGVGAIFSWRVHFALAPLERLAIDLEARDANDLALLEDHDAPEEVRALIDALNRLLARLHSALSQEREFSDNAAHELRTPLAVLKLRAQLIERRLGGDQESMHDMAEFGLALERATDVIDRMLEIARLSSEREAMLSFNLSATVQAVTDAFASVAQTKAITFTTEIEPDIVMVGSPGALESAAYNIIENAMKFTPEGGRVHASLARVDDHVRFTVADSGPGLRTGEEELIFTRFWRADKSSAGTGLGLALVRRVALLHSGEVGAQIAADGGLMVFFEIPLLGTVT
tara:strand:+ start:1696 stop:3009 length:1314 start_codon:yes stop_codon:yes gene_type:complete